MSLDESQPTSPAPETPSGVDGAMTLEAFAALLDAGAISCTVSLPIADGRTAMRRSRIVRIESAGVSLETASTDRAAIERLITARTPMLVTARAPDAERLFFAAPTSLTPAASLDDPDLTLVAPPDKLLLTQRRTYFRMPISPGDGVSVRVWRIPDHVPLRDRPLASQECLAELLDLGAGGMRVVLRPRGGKLGLAMAVNQRFRIELNAPKRDEPMLIEGRLRYPRSMTATDQIAICGVRFTHRDNIESRVALQQLHQILAALQRAAVRNRAA